LPSNLQYTSTEKLPEGDNGASGAAGAPRDFPGRFAKPRGDKLAARACSASAKTPRTANSSKRI